MRRGQRVLSSLAGWGYHNGAAPRGKATLAKLVWQSSGPSFIVPTPRVARGAHEPPPAACPGQTPPTPTQLRSRRCRATLWMTTWMPPGVPVGDDGRTGLDPWPRGVHRVNQSFLGGPEPGVPGRGALEKVLFAGAVEVEERGVGRARLGVISDASADSLAAFLDANLEPGSCVITDGWSAYPAATKGRCTHRGTSVTSSGMQAHEVLPGVHLVFSLVKRWVMGTRQGSVSPEHVQAYFDEWVFRFNRRHSRSRGLLFHTLVRQAVGGVPVTYKSLRKAGRTGLAQGLVGHGYAADGLAH